MERALASVKRITDIQTIPGADAIECAIVGGGWPVVIRKGEFKRGELAVFLEIDSFVPHVLTPFLSKGKPPREFNGIPGERLRTIKLRGQLSQGLLLPLPDNLRAAATDNYQAHHVEGLDLTEQLGIQKWERPIPACLAGQMRGNFPSWLRKTDQERVQNLDGRINWDHDYEITLKLDGSSMTIWFHDGEWGVCSRNVDLKLDQDGNAFVDTAKQVLGNRDWPDEIAIQGELMGPGIQGNREGLTEHQFFVFDLWNIATQAYLPPLEVRHFCFQHDLNHVPVLEPIIRLCEAGVTSIQSALDYAEGPSINHPVGEGKVFKRADGQSSFKAISNRYLLEEA